MKRVDKWSSLFVIALGLCIMVIIGCRGSASKPASNPLPGWQIVFKEKPSQAMEKDVQNYIRSLPPDQRVHVGTEFYYKNGKGEHAVYIETFEANTNASWQHVLIFDGNSVLVSAEVIHNEEIRTPSGIRIGY